MPRRTFHLRWLSPALALLALGLGCKREEAPSPAERAVAPYVQWCEAQGAARNSCLVSAARVTGDAAACAKLKGAGADRSACLQAAARTAGRVEACRPLADRELVQCVLAVAAQTGRLSACEALDNVHWQGGATRGVCEAVAHGQPDACPRLEVGELASWCLVDVALRQRDAALCTRLGKDVPAVQRCAVAVAVARHAPLDCAAIFAATPDASAQHRCEVEAAVAAGHFPPCFADVALCERFLWVPRPCEGTKGTWADDCLMHQAVFSTGPFGCGAVQDAHRRSLCAQLRDAQEGYLLRAQRADAGAAASPAR